MRQLLGGDLDADSYARLLLGQYRVHRAWERRHAAWLADEVSAAGWTYLNRSERLVRDLAELGLRPEDEPMPDPAAAASRTITDPSASWGALYVIEGAALGGQVLLRKLQLQWPDHPHRFFSVGLEQAHGSWRRFQSMLDTRLSSPPQLEAAAAEARGMFLRVLRMLETVK